jgi:rhodanese-related sulfurtransferase
MKGGTFMTQKSHKQTHKSKTSQWWKWVLPLVLLGAVLVAVVFALSAPAEQKLAQEITVAEVARLRESGAFILDVREVSEWNELHVPGASLIPLGELSSRLSEVPKDRPVVVMCRSGNRSKEGRDILINAGFEQVTSMAGGIREWSAAGYETVTGP